MMRVSKVDARTLLVTVHASEGGERTLCGRAITGLRNRWFILGGFRSTRWLQHEVTCENCVGRLAKIGA